ncbi:hypothetical protein BH24ACT5_BH24ACT5_19440 [soil metagenome]
MAVLALGVFSGGMALDASGIVQAHGGGTNGCTLSPDVSYVPVYYNFHNSCDAHDLCYIYKPYGNSSAGRKACDDQFYYNMRSWCRGYYSSWNPARYTCYGVAYTYYSAVRTFGGAFF